MLPFAGSLTLILLGAMAVPATAADQSSLKEILERAQSQSERKAVEDLIDKLQGAARKTSPPAAAARPSELTRSMAPVRNPAPEVPKADQGASPAIETPGPTKPAPEPEVTRVPESTKEADAARVSPAPPAAAAPSTPSETAAAKPDETREQPSAAEQETAGAPAESATSAPLDTALSASAVTTDAALDRADQKRAPTVDLEIFFAYRSAEITPQAISALATLGRALSDARLAEDSFLIAGHTDGKGSDQYNLRLSEARAQAVREFLVVKFGIDAGKLVAKGYGKRRLKSPQQPMASENRRVQIVNLTKDAKP
jgi:outer membrane protein OmpA-like peptidoglycan-associated protein